MLLRIQPAPLRRRCGLMMCSGFMVTMMCSAIMLCAVYVWASLRLQGLLEVLPDNKIVEDIHNAVRKDAKKTTSSKHCTVRMQDVVTASQVLESRNIPHPARATEEYFVRNFKLRDSATTRGSMHRQ